MRRLLFIPIFAMLVAGCSSNVFTAGGGRFAADNRSGIIAARKADPAAPEVNDICDVDSLETERNILRDRSHGVKQFWRGTSTYKRGNESNEWPDPRLMLEFDASLDAAYRDVTASCRAYARCMQNNYFNEGQCRSSYQGWRQARDEFDDLSRELAEIEAEIRRDRIDEKGRGRKGGRHHGLNQYERCDCSQSTGGVFANCCDRDSDSAYYRHKQ